jgi:hypothetical protein
MPVRGLCCGNHSGTWVLRFPSNFQQKIIIQRISCSCLACEQALWIELEPAGLVNKNTSVPITIYSVVNQMWNTINKLIQTCLIRDALCNSMRIYVNKTQLSISTHDCLQQVCNVKLKRNYKNIYTQKISGLWERSRMVWKIMRDIHKNKMCILNLYFPFPSPLTQVVLLLITYTSTFTRVQIQSNLGTAVATPQMNRGHQN